MVEKPIMLKGSNGPVPTRLFIHKNKYHAYFPYDEQLKDDIKFMWGSRWNPDEKCWTFPKNQRNDFQLAYLLGRDPYARYNCEIAPVNQAPYKRPLFPHQREIVNFIHNRKQCIVAAEMGLGKTLAGIEVLERLHGIFWWVGPRLTLSSVQLELEKWECKVAPELMTYDKMKSLVSGRLDHASVPNVVIFDESSKLKSPTSQRTKSAIKLGNLMREVHNDPYIILFSGRPAPNSPSDWWAQAEVACPGFLREGKFIAFEQRLCLKQKHTNLGGQDFYKTVTWWDDPQKCQTCGVLAEIHSKEGHPWVPSVNEVEKLNRRLDGLVLPIFKKDCLDLPEKNYLRIRVKPNPRAKMLARQLRNECATPGDLMYRLRALSDGYIVKQIRDGEGRVCAGCDGAGKVTEYTMDLVQSITCHACHGDGRIYSTVREYHEISSPKVAAFTDVLDNYHEHGRLIAWAPLHGSMDLLQGIGLRNGWNVIQFDGRKSCFHNRSLKNPPETEKELLQFFQEGPREDPVLFVGNPEAAGMGLTLTAADAMVFYSNSWKPEARQQAEDRIHRPGTTGARIIDIVCMPIDEVIREALLKKEKLQDLSLGKIQSRLDELELMWD